MNKIIETIRGVVGVSGVILWEKRTNNFHKLLPARFGQEMVDQLYRQLARFCEVRDQNCGAIVRFQKGWLFLHNHSTFALLVIGKSDLNTTTLNLVAKSSISALENALGSQTATPSSNVKFLPEHASALARAINLSLGFLQAHVSRFEIAELLRQAKSDLIAELPSLKHFSIDANGGVILIKSAEKLMDITAVEAAARLVATIADRTRNRTGSANFNVEKVTAPLRDTLNELGFYRIFKESLKTRA
jgi:hypothetical protein